MNHRLRVADSAAFERQLGLAAFVIVLAFGIFLIRLFQLQIIQGDALRARSERNSIRTIRLAAPRGEILDREGRVLATTRPAFGLQVIPSELRRPDLVYAALGQLIEQDPAALRERSGEPRGARRFQPVRLASDLTWDHLARVESHRYALPGVLTDIQPRRHYLQGPLAAHALGTIGEIRKEQLETRRFARYRAGEVIGQSGMESVLESHLRGREGGLNVVVDAAGREIERLDEVEPEAGRTAVLTLDLDLQQEAYAAFESDASGEPRRVGALVALDPRDGEVLAWVSTPSYDPNDFAGGIDSATWKRLTQDERRPLQDRVIAGQYPPASTYKAIVAAAALQEGVIDPNERLYCPGSFRLGRRSYRCWKRGGHGDVDLREALVRSCDVYFYQVGLRLGVDRLAFFARGLGLGRRTGVELPGEQAGHVPTSAWKSRRFGEPWVLGETLSAAIGQGFNTATPLQLAVAFAAIANGGGLVTPRLVRNLHARDALSLPSGSVHRERVPVDAKHLARVREALVGVVQDTGGTGARARVTGVAVGGKTGTAQIVGLEQIEGLEDDEIPWKYRDHGWFVAFAPAEQPEIVVAVLVEHGGGGGAVAAPIAQRVLARYFEKRAPTIARAREAGSDAGR
ncbi:MAG: penicillin-binding protein 2 [Deltaproteobacteria bacterium]|nr:MAG: penicillin-binding protein 2 [Deltaproteobacteria bacterium]